MDESDILTSNVSYLKTLPINHKYGLPIKPYISKQGLKYRPKMRSGLMNKTTSSSREAAGELEREKLEDSGRNR